MNLIIKRMERMVEDGEASVEDIRECAEKILELREEYPDAWSVCSIASDEVLEVIINDE